MGGLRLGQLAIGALLALAGPLGCGGGDEATSTAGSTGTEPPARDAAREPTVVAALGDSITAGSPLWDPDPQIRAGLGSAADERSQFEYWASEGDPSLEFRNCGVFGERTDQIAVRLDECAAGADALIVQGGINDIAQGRPVADAAADLRAMVRAGLGGGLDVAIADVLPWNNGFPQARGPIDELNAMIETIGEEEGVPVLPFYETLEDPDRPGTMRAQLTIDGDHPSVAGYRLIAERALPRFEAIGG